MTLASNAFVGGTASVALEHTMQSAQEIACACGTIMVATADAIGRTRMRCPQCDGVAQPRRRSPDDVALMPQGLVRVQQLPAIAPGQLRCQICARGVDGDARLCERCAAAMGVTPGGKGTLQQRRYNPKTCTKDGCDTVFMPSGPRALFCEAHR